MNARVPPSVIQGNRILRGLAVCLALAACGCASLSEEACSNADWREIGRADGSAGRASLHVHVHARSCRAFGVEPDEPAWRAGREEGLAEYCRPENAFRVGRSGMLYRGVCPKEKEYLFLREYNAGLDLYRVESAIVRARNEIDRRERRLYDSDVRIGERMEVRARIRDLQREIRFLERKLARMKEYYGVGESGPDS